MVEVSTSKLWLLWFTDAACRSADLSSEKKLACATETVALLVDAVARRAVRTEQVNTRLSTAELRTLKKLAAREHLTVAETIRILIVRAGSRLGTVKAGGVV